MTSHNRSRTHLSLGKDSPVPGRSRAPKQARLSPFHRLADSTIVTSDRPPERRPAHHRRQQRHRSAGTFGPCAWQARICRFDCCMAACQRRNPLSCHRICSPPLTRGHKIRMISAQIEFLGGTSLHVAVGTTKKSIEAMPSAWFRRNVFQDCQGGRRPRARCAGSPSRSAAR